MKSRIYCGRSLCKAISGRKRRKRIYPSLCGRLNFAGNRSITSCFTDLRGSAKPRWRTLSQAKWAYKLKLLRDLAAILTNLNEGDVLFIDEIHRLNHNVEEILYPAMEDYSLDIILGKGPSARSVQIPLKKFTLVGATTRAGMLSSPLRDRFGVICRLETYTTAELAEIVTRSARTLGTEIERGAAEEIARRSRGTPRIANRLLKRVRDFSSVMEHDEISLADAKHALDMLEIDELGLDNIDIRLLTSMIDKFGGGPVGLDTLSATVNEDSNTIEDVYEPYLLQLGFIARSPRGRMATDLAYAHLGRKTPDRNAGQSSIFDGEKYGENK